MTDDPGRPPRFPYAAALLCAACVGAAVWGWLPLLLEMISGDEMWIKVQERPAMGGVGNAATVLRDGTTFVRSSWRHPRPAAEEQPACRLDPATVRPVVDRIPAVRGRWHNDLVDDGTVLVFHIRRWYGGTTQLVLHNLITGDLQGLLDPLCRALETSENEAAREAAEAFRRASRDHDRMAELRTETTGAFRFTPLEGDAPWRPACLVVGAMGVFVFTVALRHWLSERRKFRQDTGGITTAWSRASPED